jgi:hypothetical protein
MDDELKQALEAMEGRINKRFDEVDERIHDTETKLLTAFHDWVKPIQSRMKVLSSVDERLGFMEERITKVEGKLLERGM